MKKIFNLIPRYLFDKSVFQMLLVFTRKGFFLVAKQLFFASTGTIDLDRMDSLYRASTSTGMEIGKHRS
jgi:HD superfamily phosphohydrolase